MLRKLGIESFFLNLIKNAFKNPIVDMKHNSERQWFPPKIQNKAKMSAFFAFFQYDTGMLARTIGQ